jgi:hypothetical protein
MTNLPHRHDARVFVGPTDHAADIGLSPMEQVTLLRVLGNHRPACGMLRERDDQSFQAIEPRLLDPGY